MSSALEHVHPAPMSGKRGGRTHGPNCDKVNDHRGALALNANLYHNSLPKFLLANTQSILNKIDELEAIVTNNRVDVACITESWLNDDVATQLVNLSGYICYRRDRQDGRRG
jgi:hypothetical protein